MPSKLNRPRSRRVTTDFADVTFTERTVGTVSSSTGIDVSTIVDAANAAVQSRQQSIADLRALLQQLRESTALVEQAHMSLVSPYDPPGVSGAGQSRIR